MSQHPCHSKLFKDINQAMSTPLFLCDKNSCISEGTSKQHPSMSYIYSFPFFLSLDTGLIFCECSCIIEFDKTIKIKRQNMRFGEHFIAPFATIFYNSIGTLGKSSLIFLVGCYYYV